jgi:four helix bundle protein
MGSASKLEYHLLLVRDLKLLPEAEYQTLNPGVLEVKRMLASFIQKLKTDN